ncbi:hypothetical protein TNCV_2298031 [Trichonephila clavipes]|nr:hypothetical protein TNCV_2298031 [Trichonephila clavipes]
MKTGCLCKGKNTGQSRLEETVDRVRQSFLGVSSSFQTNFCHSVHTGYLEQNKEKRYILFLRYKRHVSAEIVYRLDIGRITGCPYEIFVRKRILTQEEILQLMNKSDSELSDLSDEDNAVDKTYEPCILEE